MSNQVYANGREVSCKAAAGKSICAFPDVCLTPPQTPATPPGVPLPYPNTGLASDSTDGTSTVQISGQTVMLKDKSYFKKSTGDEAGCAPKKGVITSSIQGKVYFSAWSMNVHAEGENVVRHLDLTTGNHACPNANEAITWPYTDEMVALFESEICKDKEELRLVPYSKKCPDGGTPHHLIPDRCAKGKPNYAHRHAPCLCVQGKNQHTGSHRGCHRIFDPFERACQEEGQFDYQTARSGAAASAGGGVTPPGILEEDDKACLEAQLDAYYVKDPNGPRLSSDTPMNSDPHGAVGKVNELYDDVVAIFKATAP